MNTHTGLQHVDRRPRPNLDAVFASLGEPLVVAPRTAWRMLDCSSTHGYVLLNAGELQSFLSGRSRKITVASIRAYIARKLAAASGGGIVS